MLLKILIGGAGAAMLLVGCTAPAELGLDVALPAAFSESGGATLPDPWWRVFDDPELNRLERAALENSFSLESAWQRLRQAEAIADRERSGLFPDLDAFGDGSTSAGGGSGEVFGMGLAAAYEVDLWGRIRSQVEAEELRARAGLADYRTAALTLSAEIARTWFALVESWAQLALVESQIDTNQKVLNQLRVRLGKGQGRAVDVLRQEQLLRATLEQQTIVEADIGVFGNRLAVLQGKAPDGTARAAGHELPELPPLPITGLPLHLLQRRPDVLAAFFRLRAADADLASAVSDRYPRINLAASLTSTESDVSDLFDNWISTLAADLVAPLIDGGERVAEVERTRAARAEQLADYGQTVLVAIQEVEDNLVLERQQRRRIVELERQLELARRSYRGLLTEYLNGVGNFIDLLTALTEEQQLQRDLLTARRNLIEFRIGLYRALAGGFRSPRES